MEAEKQPQETDSIKGRFYWLTRAQKASEYPQWSDSVVGYCSIDSDDGMLKIPVFSGVNGLQAILEVIAKNKSLSRQKTSLPISVLVGLKEYSDRIMRVVSLEPSGQKKQETVESVGAKTEPASTEMDTPVENNQEKILKLKQVDTKMTVYPHVLSVSNFNINAVMATASLEPNRNILIRYSDLGFSDWNGLRAWVNNVLKMVPIKHGEKFRYKSIPVTIQYFVANNAISTAVSKFRFVTIGHHQIIESEDQPAVEDSVSGTAA